LKAKLESGDSVTELMHYKMVINEMESKLETLLEEKKSLENFVNQEVLYPKIDI
jgi:hypothetical protein